MTDLSSTPAIPVTIHRGDYRPPEWQVPDIALDFALGLEETKVAAALSVVRHADAPTPLMLRGDGLTPAAVRVDGESWNDWRMDGDDLIVDLGVPVENIWVHQHGAALVHHALDVGDPDVFHRPAWT
ncbi:protein of unknown function [uncultured Sphingopyxis sp.]|uniref:Uncharacterized protein n=1 Tax=uncultured Sphingopyxis sp. TaxID=310581 RepID=A0A1Y5PUU8_9SPHN|nr:hypothetical protein [uncultured Sphingopyxis sp.]SBV33793.1 protein of unknown function [uncultured Sphingopyxis sp.]